jgi:hypothetical protein
MRGSLGGWEVCGSEGLGRIVVDGTGWSGVRSLLLGLAVGHIMFVSGS